MGLTDQLKDKTVLVPGNQAPEVVARGEAELGIAHVAEALPVVGVEVVGPFPGEYASMTTLTAGVGSGATSRNVAEALIQYPVSERGEFRASPESQELRTETDEVSFRPSRSIETQLRASLTELRSRAPGGRARS
jgi:ABC-type molybdate transport system substrate-binding protein